MFGEDRLVIMRCMLENVEGDRWEMVKIKCILRIATHTILNSILGNAVLICRDSLDIVLSPAPVVL